MEVNSDVEFDKLFREQYPRLVALGAALSGSREVASELAQETMLRAHRHWHDVGGFDRPEAWLRRVMTNLLIDHHRSSTAEEAALDRIARARVVQLEAADDWVALIAPLPMRQRVIVTLFYGEDRSIGEISEMLKISRGTVKSALSRARQRLHEVLLPEVGHGQR